MVLVAMHRSPAAPLHSAVTTAARQACPVPASLLHISHCLTASSAFSLPGASSAAEARRRQVWNRPGCRGWQGTGSSQRGLVQQMQVQAGQQLRLAAAITSCTTAMLQRARCLVLFSIPDPQEVMAAVSQQQPVSLLAV